IYGDYIAYGNGQGTETKIFLVNIAAKTTKQISPTGGDYARPSIYGENVVFFKRGQGAGTEKERRLYVYNILKATLEAVHGVNGTGQPVIYEDRIVWLDEAAGKLMEYRLTTKNIRPVTPNFSKIAGFDLHGKRLVWAGNRNGQWGLYAILFDDLAPDLTVTEPADNLRTYNSLMAVAGFTEPGSTVKINGTTAATDTAGNFNQVVELSTGANVITISSADKAGNTAGVNRTVYYYDDKVYDLEISPDPVILGSGAYIQYTLARKGSVTVKVFDARGNLVRTVSNSLGQNAGAAGVSWDGKNDSGSLVPDGKYKFVVETRDEAGKLIGRVEKEHLAARYPRITDVTDTPDPFNPAGGPVTIKYTVSSDSLVTMNIMNSSGPVRTIMYNEPKSAGNHSVQWDGRDAQGNAVGDGPYAYQIEAVSSTVYD
ncbi:MAG: hypothetical protein FDZ75_05595, partial [Actinobacteria bacterium]